MYALCLADDKRIMSVTYDRFAPADQPRVDELPEGDVADYKYINNEFVYDPVPRPVPPEPEPTLEDRVVQNVF